MDYKELSAKAYEFCHLIKDPHCEIAYREGEVDKKALLKTFTQLMDAVDGLVNRQAIDHKRIEALKRWAGERHVKINFSSTDYCGEASCTVDQLFANDEKLKRGEE